MLVRPFEASDADALATLFHASVREAGIRDYSPEQVEAWSPAKPDPGRTCGKHKDGPFWSQ